MKKAQRRYIPGLALIIEQHIRGIYTMWHACGLPKAEGGLPKGTLCDDCNDMIAAHVKDILADIDKAEIR